jgi:hypothetical protein
MGIEPTPSAWKAEVLPLNYTRRDPALDSASPGARRQHDSPRASASTTCARWRQCTACEWVLVEGGGFEPPKAEPSDLQSDPFDRSGTPPNERRIVRAALRPVNTILSKCCIARRFCLHLTRRRDAPPTKVPAGLRTGLLRHGGWRPDHPPDPVTSWSWLRRRSKTSASPPGPQGRPGATGS